MSLKPIVNENDNAQGNMNANLVIVEYGDYQCPYCRAAYPIVKELVNEFKNEIKFVFRNFPLSEMHPYARIAAIATEAASLQDKFWEMHDGIYENQEYLNENLLITLAEKLELNIPEFKRDMKRYDLEKKVDTDFESGVISGVNGTPSFFVNNEKFNGSAIDLFQLIKETVAN